MRLRPQACCLGPRLRNPEAVWRVGSVGLVVVVDLRFFLGVIIHLLFDRCCLHRDGFLGRRLLSSAGQVSQSPDSCADNQQQAKSTCNPQPRNGVEGSAETANATESGSDQQGYTDAPRENIPVVFCVHVRFPPK